MAVVVHQWEAEEAVGEVVLIIVVDLHSVEAVVAEWEEEVMEVVVTLAAEISEEIKDPMDLETEAEVRKTFETSFE